MMNDSLTVYLCRCHSNTVPNMALSILFTLATIGFAASIFWFKKQQAVARTRALEAVASEIQLPFEEKDSFGLIAQLKGFDLFKRERRRKWFRNGKIANVMRSKVGETEVYLFDYIYVVSTGKSSKKVAQTVFFANDKNWYLPNFRLKPETWWHKVLGKLGAKTDINFSENPEFSDKYWLTGELESLIRKQFGPELQQFLSERPPTHLEGNNYYLLAYKPGTAIGASQTKAFFDHCCQLVKLLQKEGGQTLFQLADVTTPEGEPLPEVVKTMDKLERD